ncbi:uncharacterized protein EI90DRAFT_2585833 [Cantharellus anzutake]|uniref:uncharacterized protein n=1 Tax=Cantharellus anzutake TaxID=1750568 RepID=UPI001902EB1D|nr:uncharacterized protein EI90DRAFT_2585833 [Cantharellus anzutake]KAF8320979.1 hypothetical protein EI90DRAFT_2585833 [Cantharellus anzutake]
MYEPIGSCAICADVLMNPCALPSCGHVFCFECLNQYLGAASSLSSRQRPPKGCPMCRKPAGHSPPIKLFVEPLEKSLTGPTRSAKAAVTTRSESNSQETNTKSWAEATIPVPLFALVHVKNLQNDLAALRSEYERTQVQLQTADNRVQDLQARIGEKEIAIDDISRQVQVVRCVAQRNAAEASSMRSSLEHSQGELSTTQLQLAEARLEIEMLRRILATIQHKSAGTDGYINTWLEFASLMGNTNTRIQALDGVLYTSNGPELTDTTSGTNEQSVS